MNPSDLLAETVFGKRTSSKKHHPAGPHFGVQNLAPKVGALINRNGFAAPVLGSEIWTPKRGPTNVVFSHIFGRFSVRLQRPQTWPSMLVETLARYSTFFDDAPSEATCAPPSQRAQYLTLHKFAVQHLLHLLSVFCLFLPVTDRDKLTKAHEKKSVV